jgi:microcystin-dependent protein
MAEPFLSEIRIMSFNFPPKGWAFFNGQLLPINQNQALFSVLGTMFGEREGGGSPSPTLVDGRRYRSPQGAVRKRQPRRVGARWVQGPGRTERPGYFLPAKRPLF